MNTRPDLKLLGVALIDGQPLACLACGSTFSLEVSKRGLFETAPAWVACLACGHGDDSHPVTNGLVDAVLAGWVERQKRADRDTFTAEWRGIRLEGELYPTLDFHQTVGAAKAVYKGAQPHVKRWWRSKKKDAKTRVKAPWRAVKARAAEKAGAAVATAKVAAIGAAWTMQTGGAGAAPAKRLRTRCTVRGCRRGWLAITSRVHSGTGKAQEMKVRCAVCRRAT